MERTILEGLFDLNNYNEELGSGHATGVIVVQFEIRSLGVTEVPFRGNEATLRTPYS